MHYECAITEAWKVTQQVVLDVFNKILDVTKEALFPGRDGGLPGRSSWRACYGGPMDEKGGICFDLKFYFDGAVIHFLSVDEINLKNILLYNTLGQQVKQYSSNNSLCN